MDTTAIIITAIRRFKTFFAFVVIIAVIIYAKSISLSQSDIGDKKEFENGETLGQQNEQLTPTPTITLTPPPGQRPSGPTATSTPKPTSPPTATPNPGSAKNINDFFYPGAIQISLDDNELRLESSDDPDKITQWYKSKIESLNMNAKSFVTTKTNGNVLNKLVGDNGKQEIKVEISKKENDAKVKISVELDAS